MDHHSFEIAVWFFSHAVLMICFTWHNLIGFLTGCLLLWWLLLCLIPYLATLDIDCLVFTAWRHLETLWGTWGFQITWLTFSQVAHQASPGVLNCLRQFHTRCHNSWLCDCAYSGTRAYGYPKRIIQFTDIYQLTYTTGTSFALMGIVGVAVQFILCLLFLSYIWYSRSHYHKNIFNQFENSL